MFCLNSKILATFHKLKNHLSEFSKTSITSENRQVKTITKLYVFNEKAVIHRPMSYMLLQRGSRKPFQEQISIIKIHPWISIHLLSSEVHWNTFQAFLVTNFYWKNTSSIVFDYLTGCATAPLCFLGYFTWAWGFVRAFLLQTFSKS